MSSQALSLPFPLFGSSTTPVVGKPPGRHTGIAVALLLHFLVGLLIYRQVVDQASAPAEARKGDQLIRIINLQAAERAAAAPPMPQSVEESAPKPVVKPKPRPKPQLQKQPPLIAAPAPTPSPLALPQPQGQQQQQAQAAPAAAPATTPQAPSTVGAIGQQTFTLSQAENDRLEYAYKLAVSRAIAAASHGAVLTQQLGGTGQALVKLVLSRDGQVLEATLLRGTGFKHLDDEARFVMFRVGRFLPVPRYLKPDRPTIEIIQPVGFYKASS